MSLSKFNEDVNNVQSLANQPAQSADTLKRVFDQAGIDIKEYLNEVLTEEIDAIESDLRRKINKNAQDIETNQNNLFDLIYPIGSIYMSVSSTNPGTLFGGTWVAWGAGKVPVGVHTTETEFATVEKTGGEKTHKLVTSEIPAHNHTVTGTAHNHGLNNHTHSIPKLSGSTNSAGSHTHDVGAIKSGTSGSTQQRVCSQSSATSEFATSSAGTHSHTVTTNASTTGASSGNTANATATGSISNTGGNGTHNNLQPYITCYMWKRTA